MTKTATSCTCGASHGQKWRSKRCEIYVRMHEFFGKGVRFDASDVTPSLSTRRFSETCDQHSSRRTQASLTTVHKNTARNAENSVHVQAVVMDIFSGSTGYTGKVRRTAQHVNGFFQNKTVLILYLDFRGHKQMRIKPLRRLVWIYWVHCTTPFTTQV